MSVPMTVRPSDNPGARIFAKPLAILREQRRTYLTLNLLYYGMIVVGMVVAVFNLALQQSVLTSLGTAFTQGPLSAVGDAYLNAKVIEATTLTFLINLFIGSFATITLPSLIIPFSGLLMGAYRAILWGLIYSPTTPELQTIFLPHLGTLILEGQAYVLALLGVVIQGRGLLWPHTVGASTHRQGLAVGIRKTAQLYILVTVVLAVAAVYEVLESILLFSVLR